MPFFLSRSLIKTVMENKTEINKVLWDSLSPDERIQEDLPNPYMQEVEVVPVVEPDWFDGVPNGD